MSSERGQVSVVVAVVAVVVALVAIALAQLASVMVDRATARSAADALALGGGDDALRTFWTAQGAIEVPAQNGVEVRVGETTARAWTDAGTVRSPALVAILDRAEQLTGSPIAIRFVDPVTIDLTVADPSIEALLVEFGLCVERVARPSGSVVTARLC